MVAASRGVDGIVQIKELSPKETAANMNFEIWLDVLIPIKPESLDPVKLKK